MPTAQIVDLTHPVVPNMKVYPGDPPVRYSPSASITVDSYRVTQLALGTHTGTHIDAAAHYFEQGQTVDQIPLPMLVGPACVIDVDGTANSMIDVGHLLPHENLFIEGARVLLRTGWADHYGGEDYFTRHASLTLDAAIWIRQREIGLLGFDMPSPAIAAEPVHRVLLSGDNPIVIVESLRNLDCLPDRFTFIGLPLQLTGLDASPVRAIAVLDQ